MSTYTDTVRRLCAALGASARTMGLTDDPKGQRRALAELATWLRVLGFKADQRLDHLRIFGVELFIKRVRPVQAHQGSQTGSCAIQFPG